MLGKELFTSKVALGRESCKYEHGPVGPKDHRMERQCVVEGTIKRNYYLSDPFAPGTLFQVGGRLGVAC